MKYFLSIPVAILFLFSCNSSSTEKAPESSPTEPVETKKEEPAFVDIDVMEFKKRMNHPDVVVLDVRTPEETADGKIEGAIEIDINDDSFDNKIQALDKEKTYLVYCAAGTRSAKSCTKMAELGFARLYNLKGGYEAWTEAQ